MLASHPSETQPPYRLAAYSVAALRLALGAAALAVPEQAGAIWVGSGGQERDRAVLLRSCGGRDVALGIGAVMSLRRRSDARLWLLMGALSDFGDAVSTAARFAELPRWRRWAVLVASLAASCTGALCALNLAPPEPRA